MNKPLPPHELRRLAVEFPEFFRDIEPRQDVKTKSSAPYAKREEGRKRRDERRARIRMKTAFWNE